MSDWMTRAACRDAPNAELWFPVSEVGAPQQVQINEAKSVCQSCTVRTSCLEEALAIGAAGIWGGLTESERDLLSRAPRMRARTA